MSPDLNKAAELCLERLFAELCFHVSFHREPIVEANYSTQENKRSIEREMSKVVA